MFGDSFDYDTNVSEAWDEFRAGLADVVAGMGLNKILAVDSTFEAGDTRNQMPRGAQFYAWSTEFVRCEVPSNHYLTGDRALTDRDEARLVELGWHRPTRRPDEHALHGSPAFWVDLPYSWADKLAAMTVAAFRDVWGVPHPSFVATSGTESLALAPAQTVVPDAPTPLDLETAIAPHGVDYLRDLVEQTITATFDAQYCRDADGDMTMSVGFTTAYIWSDEQRPDIHIHVPLVRDITNRTRAAEVAADLNGQWPYFRAVVTGDHLNATCDLSADPFVPQHLYNALEILVLILGGADDDFAERLGGVFPKRGVFPSGRRPDQ